MTANSWVNLLFSLQLYVQTQQRSEAIYRPAIKTAENVATKFARCTKFTNKNNNQNPLKLVKPIPLINARRC